MRRVLLILTTAILAMLPAASMQGRENRAIVIRAQFSDVKFSSSESVIKAKVQDMNSYFNEQFSESGTSFVFDIGPTVTLGKSSAYYGANTSARHDGNLEEAVREACMLSDASVDFSKYDNDGDGYVDNVHVIFAGTSESDSGKANDIWPQWNLLSANSSSLYIDQRTVNSFSVCTETSPLGTFCHEFCHSLGLEDLYDTDGDGSGGEAKGLWGSLSIMDKGLYNDEGRTPPCFSAVELDALGAGSMLNLRPGANTLKPVGTSHEYIRIDTETTGEYFLVECRTNEGRDAFIGGKGMLVYHIDKSENNAWYSDYYMRNLTAAQRWSYNQINCRPDHQCADVMEAIPNATEVSQVFFPQPGHTALSSGTDPSLRHWNGTTSSVAITGITINDDGSVSFNSITPVTLTETIAFQDAVITRWKVDATLEVKHCKVSWAVSGSSDKPSSTYVNALDDGSFSCTMEDLQPLTTYDVTIQVECTDNQTFTHSTTVTTRARKLNKPFIWLGGSERNDDGTFIKGTAIFLRVFNAEGVAKVNWYYNDTAVLPDGRGMFTLNEGGVLKAHIMYEAGGMGIISKTIVIR